MIAGLVCLMSFHITILLTCLFSQASFGFIECCERNVRIFFHYSQFNGDPNELQVGDSVEFQETVDKRDKRPVAIRVKRISQELLELEVGLNIRVNVFVCLCLFVCLLNCVHGMMSCVCMCILIR